MSDKNQFAITIAQALERLEPPMIEDVTVTDRGESRGGELLDSLLLIAELDHTSEAMLVRNAVVNALGRLPDPPK